MQGAGCACCTRAKRDSSAGISGSGAKIVENFGARVDGFGPLTSDWVVASQRRPVAGPTVARARWCGARSRDGFARRWRRRRGGDRGAGRAQK